MSEPKGPKLDLPEDLVAEIAADESAGEGAGPAAEAAAPAEGDPAAGDGASDEAPDELAEWKDRHLRLAAEFENFKRRSLKERQDLLNFGTDIVITGRVLHRGRRSLHMHETDGNLQLGRHLKRARPSQSIDIVHHTGARIDCGLHDLGLAGIYRYRNAFAG